MRKFGILVLVLVVLALLVPMSASAAPAQTAGGPGCVEWYTIRHGDTLYRIAVRFGTTVPRLVALNGIANPNYIIAGTTICVRGGGGHEHPGGFWYVVKPGDTLAKIAWRYGWSVAYLARINHIWNPNLIWVGQRLWIPAHGWGDGTVPLVNPGQEGGQAP